MSSARADAFFGGLVGLALGIAAGASLCASGHAALEQTQGLTLALGASATLGVTCAAVAGARATRGRRKGSILFGAIVAAAACLLLRRVGWRDLNLYGFDAGFAPWGCLAAVSLPLVGLAAGVVTALDALRRAE